MNILSLFSGVGGMDLGFEQAGHTVVGMCEIDPKSRSVLARHWPHVPIHDDVTTLETEQWRGKVDIVAGGSPCQDLSVAGRRQGLDGERSGLFWHQCRIADQVAAPWIVWENVAGALSSNNGADFAAVLWGLTGALPELPAKGRWRSAGVCVGPKRTAVWRLLDAQYFGVAQRRRRVFVIAGPRDKCGPEILFEPESVFRDSPPQRETGQEVAGTLGAGTPSGGPRTDTDGMTFIPDVVGTVGPTFGAKNYSNVQEVAQGSIISEPVVYAKAGRARSVDDAETWKLGEVAPTLNQFDVGDTRATVAVIAAFDSTWSGAYPMQDHGDTSPTVKVRSGVGIASPPAVATSNAVRRLTPLECERLMGWPDDHTRWDADGKEIADSHRYRMCGNGVVAPITKWIGERLP